jgi:hypothetical protein
MKTSYNSHSVVFDQIDKFTKRIETKKSIYKKIINNFAYHPGGVYNLKNTEYFYDVLENFGPTLDKEKSIVDLKTLYDVAYHSITGSLIIANKGATLFSLSPKTSTPYITYHIGCCVYKPGLGVEVVNIGLTGNVYQDPVILRSESACTPSFIFGSQRCNCHHQWQVASELAAFFNPPDETPNTNSGEEFERWVQEQFTDIIDQHLPLNNGVGVILMHIDTQNGMGSGYSKDEFAFDLFNRASLRHRGEYSAEQIHQTTMKGGFESIGLLPDPRQENDGVGYQITPILLDWLNCSKDLIFLSNNKDKMKHLENTGYKVTRIKTIGMVNRAGAQEAEQRGTEFGHLDIDESEITFQKEIERLKLEIQEKLRKEVVC